MAIRQGKKRHPNWNKGSFTFGRCNDTICIKTLKTKSVTSNEASKDARYKINIQKSLAY